MKIAHGNGRRREIEYYLVSRSDYLHARWVLPEALRSKNNPSSATLKTRIIYNSFGCPIVDQHVILIIFWIAKEIGRFNEIHAYFFAW